MLCPHYDSFRYYTVRDKNNPGLSEEIPQYCPATGHYIEGSVDEDDPFPMCSGCQRRQGIRPAPAKTRKKKTGARKEIPEPDFSFDPEEDEEF